MRYATFDAEGWLTGFHDPEIAGVPEGAVEIADDFWQRGIERPFGIRLVAGEIVLIADEEASAAQADRGKPVPAQLAPAATLTRVSLNDGRSFDIAPTDIQSFLLAGLIAARGEAIDVPLASGDRISQLRSGELAEIARQMLEAHK